MCQEHRGWIAGIVRSSTDLVDWSRWYKRYLPSADLPTVSLDSESCIDPNRESQIPLGDGFSLHDQAVCRGVRLRG